MSIKSKIALLALSLIMIFNISIQYFVIFFDLEYHKSILFFTSLIFILLFIYYLKDFIKKSKMNTYSKKLNDVLISQSHNNLFFQGLVSEAAKHLTLEVAKSLNIDRCSIWLYNSDKSSIICQELYIKSEDRWYQNIELFKKDFKEYFDALEVEPIIIATDAHRHPSTSCFSEVYLKPLGISSMLDVPIIYGDKTIGVICIESFEKRKWLELEVKFAQMLSSIYTFSISVKDITSKNKQIEEMSEFIDKATLVTRADSKGNITYVNQKFTEVSGWSLEECLGKNHNIVNSGYHTKEFWKDMYNTVVKEKKIWNGVVTNRSKNGNLYYVDSFIKAEFDNDGKLLGYISIRQDVTDIAELNDKLNSLVSSQTSYVLRTDMNGKHTYWNQKFEDEFGWVYEGNMMHSDSLLSICESHHGAAYDAVMKCIESPGKIVKVELDKPHRDGSRRTTFWEFVCLTDKAGQPLEVQCMGIDITDRVKAEKKIIEVLREVERKNVYLEHAAKILRHDMHSGINTYIPRGISSLERRISDEQVRDLKIEAPLKMIKEGLKHSQKVYKGVYEFTNLVKKDVILNKSNCNLSEILKDYLSTTAYLNQVKIGDLGSFDVNDALFCTAIDNLIRNGLKYNDSNSKFVKIYRVDDTIYIEDNGRGMSQKDFDILKQPYTRKEGQKETGTGLGLNICIAILEEHGFAITCDKMIEGGTQLKINLKV
jgi:PAS domain S-box-containing protein